MAQGQADTRDREQNEGEAAGQTEDGSPGATEESDIPESGPGARPYGAYAAIVGAFGAGSAVAYFLGRLPPLRLLDVLLLGLATFRFGRVMADDLVTMFIRAPFVEARVVPAGEGASQIEELPRGSGLRVAIGQLIECRTCIAFWGAAGQVWGLMLAPRLTRPVIWLLAASGAGEILEIVTSAAERLGRK